jgi:hypothetical protein
MPGRVFVIDAMASLALANAIVQRGRECAGRVGPLRKDYVQERVYHFRLTIEFRR